MRKLLSTALLGCALTAGAQFTNVNVGTSANDGTGDNLRAAFSKVNGNFTVASNLFMATPASPLTSTLITTQRVVMATNINQVFMLPAAASDPGRNLSFFNTLGITNTSVRTTNGLLVWNGGSSTNYTLTNAGQSLRVYAYGTNWYAR